VETSILEADDHLPARWTRGNTRRRIGSAWREVDRAGRVIVAVASVLVVAVTVAWDGETVAAVATGASLLVLVVAALVDVVEHRLPNALLALAATPAVVALVAAGSVELVRGAALGAAVLGGPLLVTHLVSPTGMGFGDVKAGVVLGAALGLIDVQVALLALVLGLAAAATWGLVRRSRTVAFGPGLVAGAILGLAIARWAGVEAVAW
jgi:leader peptidase (prepilin peptidase)/N-methyltransferase